MGNNLGRFWCYSVEVNGLFGGGGDKFRGFKKCFFVLIIIWLNKIKYFLYVLQIIYIQGQDLGVGEVCFKQIENFKGVEFCVEYIGVEFGLMFF